jgi:cold shock CspA family protein
MEIRLSAKGDAVDGTMLWFNHVKDRGFISTEEGERLFVRGAGFARGAKPEGRCAGLPVSFRVSTDAEGRQAEDVVFVAQDAPRRARMRHSARRLGS